MEVSLYDLLAGRVNEEAGEDYPLAHAMAEEGPEPAQMGYEILGAARTNMLTLVARFDLREALGSPTTRRSSTTCSAPPPDRPPETSNTPASTTGTRAFALVTPMLGALVRREVMVIIGSFAVVFVLFIVIVIATMARAPIAARMAGTPEEIPVVSTRLSVTLFHVAMLAMSLYLMVVVGTQVLYGAGGKETLIVPIGGALFFAYGYVLARYRSDYAGRLSHRQWVGGADGETAELFSRAYRERAWIVGLAVVPPLLVLLARVVAFGVLGTPADLPAGAGWS